MRLLPRPIAGLFHTLGAALVTLSASPVAAQSSDLWTLGEPPHTVPPPVAPARPPPEPSVPQPPVPQPPVEPAEAPGPLAPARWQLAAQLIGSIFAIHYGAGADPSYVPSGNRGLAAVSATLFLKPVEDDDAPRSLQPFLQRTSTVSVGINGYGLAVSVPGTGLTNTESRVLPSISADVYLARAFALTGGFQYGYDVVHNTVAYKTHQFIGSAGFGVRLGDVRFDGSYTFLANDIDGRFDALHWGPIDARLYAVIARSVALTVRGEASEQGGSGGLDLGYYPTKDLGLFLGGTGARVAFFIDRTYANQYFGDAGFSYWVSRMVRLGAYYELTALYEPVQTGNAYSSTQLNHAVHIEGNVRLP